MKVVQFHDIIWLCLQLLAEMSSTASCPEKCLTFHIWANIWAKINDILLARRSLAGPKGLEGKTVLCQRKSNAAGSLSRIVGRLKSAAL